jgi:hypothetical protein
MKNDNKNYRIGYRYLFDSKGCSLAKSEEVKINLTVSEKYDVQVYFGPKPRYKIDSVIGCSKYYVPGTKVPLGRCQINSDTSQSSEHGPFFLEIVVSTEADIVESGNINLLSKQAETRRDEFKNILNFVAGIIGLRFHRQFVLELLNENVLAWQKESHSKGFAGPAVEMLEPITLNENGINQLEVIGEKLKALPCEDVQTYSLIFHWLLRAWHERDIIYEFIDLFIPIECVLNILCDSKMSAEDKRCAKAIRVLIKKHAGSSKEELAHFLNKLAQNLKPTLNERFIDFAKTANLPGWENDIQAFKRFNHMRNILLHGADKAIQQRISIGDEEVRTLSDIVERYINYFFFKDNNVYQSRRRTNSSRGAS